VRRKHAYQSRFKPPDRRSARARAPPPTHDFIRLLPEARDVDCGTRVKLYPAAAPTLVNLARSSWPSPQILNLGRSHHQLEHRIEQLIQAPRLVHLLPNRTILSTIAHRPHTITHVRSNRVLRGRGRRCRKQGTHQERSSRSLRRQTWSRPSSHNHVPVETPCGLSGPGGSLLGRTAAKRPF